MIDDFCQVGTGLTFGAEKVSCGKMGPAFLPLGEEGALSSLAGSGSSKDEYDLEFWVVVGGRTTGTAHVLAVVFIFELFGFLFFFAQEIESVGNGGRCK